MTKMESLQWNLEEDEQVEIDKRCPELIDAEIMTAIDMLKNEKAEGGDGISAELLKALRKRKEDSD